VGKRKRVKQKGKRHWWVIPIAAIFVVGGLGAGLYFSGAGDTSGGGSPITPTGDRFGAVAAGDLPPFVRQASRKIREAYRYAADHPEVLQYIPCFCGCENVGHRHNGDCYVKERHADGRITFTNHAAT
jgi:hypothetical protein